MRISPILLALTALLAVFAVAVSGGCDGAEPPGEGEGEDAGEGEGEEVGEGEGEGEGEVSGCDVVGCDPGQECGSIFGGDPETACYVTCNDGAVPCTTANGLEGECRNIAAAFDAPVCRAQAANLGRCGNDVNSGCVDDDAVCVDFADADLFADGERTCVRACDVDADCGDAALGCSQDLNFLLAGDPAPHGVCAPLTAVASPCGRRGDGTLAFCTSDQACNRGNGESQGACE